MKSLAFLFFMGLISQNVFAVVPTLNCVVKKPCLFKANLGYCLDSNFAIRQEPMNDGRYVTAAVVSIQSTGFGDRFEIAAIIPVAEKFVQGIPYISGSSNEGQIALYPMGFRSTAKDFTGALTLGRNLEFDIVCSPK